MFNPDGGLDYIIKEAIVWLINHEVTVIQLAIPVMVMCTSAAFAFSVLGKGGKSIWKMWWAVILTLIFVKPALAWLFALCAWALSNAPNPGDTSVSLLALFIAMLLPLLMLFVFYKKSDPPIHPMMMAAPGVGSAHVSHQQSGMGKFLAPAAGAMGWMAASHAKNSEAVTNDPSSATPRTPGARRVAAASFTSSKAVTLAGAHPMGAAVLGLGSIALGQSGKRAATKKGPGAVNPPQPPPSAPPQAPLRARPSNPGGNSKPGSPPNPVIRAPHELPTSTRRPSLGRKNTERRSQ
jgi:hypothetical protein